MMPDYQYRSVLVTGGAGFIGSRLVETLVEVGAHVTVLDNLQAGKWTSLDIVPDVSKIEGDVRDYIVLESILRITPPDIVFHLAANASVPLSVEEPRYDFEANSGGTVALLESLRHFAPDSRFVLASSAAVYGQPQRFPIVETDAFAPISPYGASKVTAEVETKIYQTVYGIPAVIARIFNTYGPRMPRFVVLDFLRKLRQNPGRLEILGDGEQIRDFNYVADTVSGLLCLGQYGIPGEAYNISSGISCSVTELAQMLLKILGLEDKTEIVYTGSSWVGDAQRWEVDISKACSLGYQPKMGLEEGLRHVIDWFEQRYL